MTIRRGQYSSKKKALAVNGKIFRCEDRVYRALAVTAEYDGNDYWTSVIEAREATPEEERTMQLALLREQLDKCRAAWSDDPTDPFAIQNRDEIARLKQDISALEAV